MKEQNQREFLITTLSAVMDAMSAVISQNIEMVLHDLKNPSSSVIKIINGHVSGRKEGSALLDGLEDDLGYLGVLNQTHTEDTAPEVYSNYKSVNASGNELISATVFFKDKKGKPRLALCMNADYSVMETAKNYIDLLMPKLAVIQPEKKISSLEVKMNEIIVSSIPPNGTLRANASKSEKVDIVKDMQEKGLFIVRGGVEKAAKALGVTRYTIYNYLDEIKNQ